MPLTDTAIRSLKPKAKRYSIADARGLCIEVYPTGGKVWHYRYRTAGKQERVTIGKYPDLPLKLARAKRDEYKTQVALGNSPAKDKQLVRRGLGAQTTVKAFAERYFADRVIPAVKNSTATKRYLDKDILPYIGSLPIGEVSTDEIQAIVFRKKDNGQNAAAGQLRGVLKRLFEYAVVRGVIKANPVLALPMRFISTQRSRTRALTPSELRTYLHTIYKSNIRTQFKLALHLILITMVRKSELLLADWKEVDLVNGEWSIPAEHSKTGVPHKVYLSTHAKEIFAQLRSLAGLSTLVLPGRGSLVKPFAHNALNHALNGLNFSIPHFTIHDMRRTSSTLLNEAGFPSEVIEKSLNHTMGGVRAVYNRAQYAEPRKQMLQYWSTYIDSLLTGENVVLGPFRAP